MRLPLLFLLGAALLLAGCAKESDTPADGGDGTNTTTTTPTGGTTTTTPPTDPTGGGNSTTPPAPMAMELCAKTKDFSPPHQTPAPPANPTGVSSESCGTPGAEYTKILLNVTWSAATAVPATTPASPPTVTLLDSAGTAVGTCTGPTGQTVSGTCTAEGAIVAGEYTLRYESTGNLKATISVMVS